MAGLARGVEIQERASRVAVRAVLSGSAMIAIERESGLLSMIESGGVEAPNVVVSAAVFGVAHGTVASGRTHLPMEASVLGNSIGYQIVADEAVLGGDDVVGAVAGVAHTILEVAVGRAQRPGHGIGDLALHRGRSQYEDQKRGDDHRIRTSHLREAISHGQLRHLNHHFGMSKIDY